MTLSAAVESALREAERTGFRYAVIGRTVAILIFTCTSIWGYYFPINFAVAGVTAAIGVVGLSSLLAVGSRYERPARFALFAFDALIISALLAFAPLSSGDAIPQNLAFLTSRVDYYYVIVASAILTLSPVLVLWTGAWAVGGLVAATIWIMSGMDRILSFDDLPPGPSRDVYFQTVRSKFSRHRYEISGSSDHRNCFNCRRFSGVAGKGGCKSPCKSRSRAVTRSKPLWTLCSCSGRRSTSRAGAARTANAQRYLDVRRYRRFH